MWGVWEAPTPASGLTAFRMSGSSTWPNLIAYLIFSQIWLPVQTTPQFVNLFVSHDDCPAPVACADHTPVRELVSFIRHLHLPHLQHQPSEDVQPPAILLLFCPPCSPELWLHMLPGEHDATGWVGKGKKRLNDESSRRARRVGLVRTCS